MEGWDEGFELVFGESCESVGELSTEGEGEDATEETDGDSGSDPSFRLSSSLL